MKNLTLIACFICCSFVHTTYGQDFEGTILFEISYSNLTEEMKQMLPERIPESLLSVKDNKTKMEMDVMGAKMIIISDTETGISTSYTDVMGQKMKSITPMEDMEGTEIKLIDGETKRIAGYLCKKAIMKQPDLSELEVYYTEDLKSSALSYSEFKKLNGVPLEYQISQQGITMVYSAKEVTKKTLDSNFFDPPAGDYKEAPATPKY